MKASIADAQRLESSEVGRHLRVLQTATPQAALCGQCLTFFNKRLVVIDFKYSVTTTSQKLFEIIGYIFKKRGPILNRSDT